MGRQRLMHCSMFVVTIISIVMLNGCSTTTGYKEPINDFQNASSIVTDSARVYVTQLNKTQRDAYIDRQISEAKQIKLTEIEKVQLFSREEIAARLGALNSLSKYGELLGQLANSDAPENITANAENLAKSLEKVASNVNNLSASGNTNLQSAFGPVALLAGEVSRFVVEKKIQEALNRAILGGEEPVNNLIRVIRDDLITAYELKRSALGNNRVMYVDVYEKERLKGRDAVSLKRYGRDIKSILDLWEGFPASNPNEGLDAMAAAHSALVDYARSSQNREDLAAFAAQMEAYFARAKRVGNAVHQLYQIKNN